MPSSEDAATLAAYVAGVDRAAVEMETKWGMDRLPMLVSDDLRAKFNRQAASWSEAVAAAYDADRVTGAQMQAVTVKAAAMQRAWAALDAFAEEAGHRAIAPWVWEARLHDGSVAAVVQTNAEASKVITEGRFLRVFTLEEIANVIDALGVVSLAKATFPGAKIQPTRRTHMLPFDDAIPF